MADEDNAKRFTLPAGFRASTLHTITLQPITMTAVTEKGLSVHVALPDDPKRAIHLTGNEVEGTQLLATRRLVPIETRDGKTHIMLGETKVENVGAGSVGLLFKIQKGQKLGLSNIPGRVISQHEGEQKLKKGKSYEAKQDEWVIVVIPNRQHLMLKVPGEPALLAADLQSVKDGLTLYSLYDKRNLSEPRHVAYLNMHATMIEMRDAISARPNAYTIKETLNFNTQHLTAIQQGLKLYSATRETEKKQAIYDALDSLMKAMDGPLDEHIAKRKAYREKLEKRMEATPPPNIYPENAVTEYVDCIKAFKALPKPKKMSLAPDKPNHHPGHDKEALTSLLADFAPPSWLDNATQAAASSQPRLPEGLQGDLKRPGAPKDIV